MTKRLERLCRTILFQITAYRSATENQADDSANELDLAATVTPEQRRRNRVPAKLMDFVIVTVAVAIIVIKLWPSSEPLTRVVIAERATETRPGISRVFDIQRTDPVLAKIRNKITLWGQPQLTPQFGFAHWQKEVSEFYAANPIPAESPGEQAPQTPEVAMQGGIIQARFSDQPKALSAEELPSLELATKLASMVSRSHNKVPPTKSQIYWAEQSQIAAADLARESEAISRAADSAGPVPFEIVGPIVPEIPFNVHLCAWLIGLCLACVHAEWSHRTPSLRLATTDADRSMTYGVRTESTRVEIPVDWITVVQPMQVKIRQGVLVAITGLACVFAIAF